MGTQTFTSSGSWVCPSGVSSVTVECWGGGGAGGVASGTASGAGGGAGGQYAIKLVTVSAGTSYTVTVGAVAVAVTTGGVVTNGNDSWFNTSGTVIAKGGAGGADATGTTGAGGTGSTTGGIGDTVFAGGSGATGVSSTQSGGGGGGAGSTGTGNSASGATAGAAKTLNGGAGGNGVSTANTQNSGNNYGGGGSGGLSTSATNRKGGDGAQGLVVLTWDIDPSIISFPFTNQPAHRLDPNKRNLSAAHIPYFSYVKAVPPLASGPYIAGQSVDPLVQQTFQYQSQSLPISATPALIFNPHSQSGMVNRPQRRLVPSFVAPVQVSTAVEQIRISGQSVDPSLVLSFQFPSLASPIQTSVPSEILTLDKWTGQARDPMRRARRLVTYGVNTAVAQEVVPAMEWSIQYPIHRRHRQGLRDYSFRSFITTLFDASTPAVFIAGQSVDPLVRQSFQFDSLANPLRALTGTPESLTLDKWYSPERVIRRKRVFIDSRTAFVKVAPFGDLITLDKWLSYQPTQFPRRKVIEGQFRFYVIPILTIPPSTGNAAWQVAFSTDLQAVVLFSTDLTTEINLGSTNMQTVYLATTDLATEIELVTEIQTEQAFSTDIKSEEIIEE